jgi:hypothetical protein
MSATCGTCYQMFWYFPNDELMELNFEQLGGQPLQADGDRLEASSEVQVPPVCTSNARLH